MSPRTVNKHLEHILEKLGVEMRTAAASSLWQEGRNSAVAESAVTFAGPLLPSRFEQTAASP
jgi:hypothetical protein